MFNKSNFFVGFCLLSISTASASRTDLIDQDPQELASISQRTQDFNKLLEETKLKHKSEIKESNTNYNREMVRRSRENLALRTKIQEQLYNEEGAVRKAIAGSNETQRRLLEQQADLRAIELLQKLESLQNEVESIEYFEARESEQGRVLDEIHKRHKQEIEELWLKFRADPLIMKAEKPPLNK